MQRATVNSDRILPQASPMTVLLAAALLAVLAQGISLLLVTQGPWLGLRLRPARHCRCWNVVSVSPGSPGAGRVRSGAHILGLSAGKMAIDADPHILLDEPDTLPTFSDFDRFMTQQGEVWKILQATNVQLRIENKAGMTVSPKTHRPVSSLPVSYWLISAVGLVAFMVGAGLWGLRRGQLATRLLAVSGAGMLIAASSAAVYVSRELALPPVEFRALSWLNHLGMMSFGAASLGLLYIYPRRISDFPLLRLLGLAVPLALTNELGQWVDLPIHTFYLPLLLIYFAAGIVIAGQWRLTQSDPVGRAVLKWFVLSIFVTIGLSVVASIVPALMRHPPLLSIGSSFATALVMYFGLVLGVARFRLFDLDNWWFEVWLWFFAGMLVVALDATLAMAVDLNPAGTITISIIVVGWIYFPVRQWLWGRIAAFSRTELEDYLPGLVKTVFTARSPEEFAERWQTFLQNIFRPLHCTLADQSVEKSTLLDEGVRLRVPGLGEGSAVDLEYRRHGHALFSPRDARLADVLHAVAVRAEESWSAWEAGVRTERARIMRDLHDDVAARLLTLVRSGSDTHDRELAGGALTALREVVYSLDTSTALPMHEVLADCRAEVMERLYDEGMIVRWEQQEIYNMPVLNPRQVASLRRMIQEAVSNVLRHARPREVIVHTSVESGRLVLEVLNDGSDIVISPVILGHGLNNMRTRAQELGGDVQWQHDDTGRFSVKAWFPITGESGSH